MKKLKIMVLENEPSLAELLKRVLSIRGHDVHVFPEPTSCPIFHDHETECPKTSPCADVIISDQMMPNMFGTDFFKLQRIRGCKAPDENKALLTGFALQDELKKTVDDLGCHYIKKPFKIGSILEWVDECAERLA